MTFMTAVRTCFSKYLVFEGRASRSEFWYFQLFIYLVLLAIVIVAANVQETASAIGTAGIAFYAAIILPGLAATVRRLHDRNRSGWHYWWVLVPIAGGLIVLIWLCQKGVEGENRFGPDPLAAR
jgi:uncharacterized membrane protein YhaH (DUF805 family)